MSYGFLHGTEVETGYGTRAIERLVPGDRVLTLAGKLTRIAWVGHTLLAAREVARVPETRPVQLNAGGLSEAAPMRNLVVAPTQGVVLCDGPGSADTRVVTAGRLTTGAKRVVVLHDLRFTQVMLEQDGFMLVSGVWCPSMTPTAQIDSLGYETQMAKMRLAG
ncbi:MAG: Hint domain-containing protein [Pseudomonadota bacterium]